MTQRFHLLPPSLPNPCLQFKCYPRVVDQIGRASEEINKLLSCLSQYYFGFSFEWQLKLIKIILHKYTWVQIDGISKMTLKSNNSNHLLLKQEKFFKKNNTKILSVKRLSLSHTVPPSSWNCNTTSRFHKKRNPKCGIFIKKWHTDLYV